MNSRLALGTAQFGLPYGVANRKGQIGREEAGAVLERAWDAGLRTLDTAIAYGDSEQRLGEIGLSGWQVVSKLPPLPSAQTDVAEWVQKSVDGSLSRLGIPTLRALLLHRFQDLLEPYGAELFDALKSIQEQGKAEKIGVSIYAPHELDALGSLFQVDIVQAPFNILDRRLETSGWLSRLQQTRTEVHVRSVFLQGLLLMPSAQRPARFSRWQPLWDQWDGWLRAQRLTPLRACLGFVLSHPGIDRVVVGVDDLQQLQEILDHLAGPAVLPPMTLMSDELSLIDPFRWSTT